MVWFRRCLESQPLRILQNAKQGDVKAKGFHRCLEKLVFPIRTVRNLNPKGKDSYLTASFLALGKEGVMKVRCHIFGRVFYRFSIGLVPFYTKNLKQYSIWRNYSSLTVPHPRKDRLANKSSGFGWCPGIGPKDSETHSFFSKTSLEVGEIPTDWTWHQPFLYESHYHGKMFTFLWDGCHHDP